METHLLHQLRKFIVPELVYGPGALQLAGQHARNFGATKVLLVTDGGVQQAGWTQRVQTSLKAAAIDCVVFDEITANPKDHEVMRGAQICSEENCDLILAVGGGSPMDAAKGIGVVVGNGRHIREYEGVDAVPQPGPPLIFVPTTAGTSADVSQFAIITDTAHKVKIAIVSKMVIPDIALVDPETAVTMPPDLTAAAGMGALSHAFEAYVSINASALTDMAALEAVRRINANLENACRAPREMRYRDPMMMAGLAFSNASLGLAHAMAHSLGGALGMAGLPEWPQEAAATLSARIAALRKRLGIEEGLKTMGVAAADLAQLAENAHKDPCLATNPRPASPREIESLYAAVYH